ncbi:MAG: camphor resistance protein CrcB [Cyanobacteria bacterium RYN_339]|nr:camphor resistance protein CrcB [Cyanobacteria bacterium RYN_339]
MGAWARLYLGLAVALRTSTGFPYGTLLINLLGCFILGVVNTLVLERGVPDVWRLAVGVGFCGAFTTFSTFGFETLALLREGRYAAAALYVLASNLLGFGCAALGWLVARA